MAEFNEAVEILLKHEGGYVHDPNDPGGETNFGISKAQYPHVNIKGLTPQKAKEIYYNDFWLKNGLNGIVSQKSANFALDTLVQHGQGGRLIQQGINKAGGHVTVDNKVGSKTIAGINSVNSDRFVYEGVGVRKGYYNSLIARTPSLAKFKKGWYRRLNFFLVGLKVVKWGGLLMGAVIAYFLIKRFGG